jgi:hypothetical protein
VGSLFYLIGRIRFKVAEHRLQNVISRWFFASSLTGRYTGSPETIMDSDLNRLKTVSDAEEFVAALDEVIGNQLTNDYWTITLPADLNSSSARSPQLFAYIAAQNRLNAPVLFSHRRISELIDPALETKKKALERHHLFPRAYLERQGITDLKQINQMATYALLEWPDNIEISDAPPDEYVPELQRRFSAADWRTMHEAHALPENWQQLEYPEFLETRRQLIASIIRRGFESLR